MRPGAARSGWRSAARYQFSIAVSAPGLAQAAR
jgi:hypothetical protein